MIDFSKIHLIAITEINGAIHRSTITIIDFKPDFNPGEYVDPKQVAFVLAAPLNTFPVENTIISKDEFLQMIKSSVYNGALR